MKMRMTFEKKKRTMMKLLMGMKMKTRMMMVTTDVDYPFEGMSKSWRRWLDVVLPWLHLVIIVWTERANERETLIILVIFL